VIDEFAPVVHRDDRLEHDAVSLAREVFGNDDAERAVAYLLAQDHRPTKGRLGRLRRRRGRRAKPVVVSHRRAILRVVCLPGSPCDPRRCLVGVVLM
jgi:hypothetical protein